MTRKRPAIPVFTRLRYSRAVFALVLPLWGFVKFSGSSLIRMALYRSLITPDQVWVRLGPVSVSADWIVEFIISWGSLVLIYLALEPVARAMLLDRARQLGVEPDQLQPARQPLALLGIVKQDPWWVRWALTAPWVALLVYMVWFWPQIARARMFDPASMGDRQLLALLAALLGAILWAPLARFLWGTGPLRLPLLKRSRPREPS